METPRKPLKEAADRCPKFMDSKTFSQKKFQREWLVEQVLVKGQPAVIGGPKKSLKTTLAVDLAISVATGTPFLDKFEVPEPRRVAVMSGESGDATLQETAKRICKAKGVSLDQASILWSSDLPRFADRQYLSAFKKKLRAQEVKLVVIDPLYLCLLDGVAGLSASNLYETGPLLYRFTRACLSAHATPIFVHHAKKGGSKVATGPLDLDDLAFSGIGEFARQWLLLSRAEPYCPGSGEHSLVLAVGGSAGQSGCWQVNVREGVADCDFTGRYWDVEVHEYEEEEAEPRNSHSDRKRNRTRCQSTSGSWSRWSE